MKRHNKSVDILLVGEMSESGKTINVWCPWCKKNHTHSWEKENKQNDVEHRVAHCFSKDHLTGGYYIGLTPKK